MTGASKQHNILLILFEYPLGTAQIVRWANIMRYVIEAGHRVTILSADFADADRPVDKSLANLLHHPSVTLVQVPAERRDQGQVQSLAWVQRAYQKALVVTQMIAFDVVISSALPIADHIIASRLRAKGHIPLWIADYGDPWSTSRTLDQAQWRKPMYQAIERRVMRHADAITITTPTAIDSFTPIYSRRDRIRVVPMAASYFHMTTDCTPGPRLDNEMLNILYTGSFYPNRHPDTLFEALSKTDGVHLTIVGKHFVDITGDLQRWNIADRVTLREYASQQEIARMQHDYDALLLTSWPVPEQISGKFYEYIATSKPILYVTNHETDIASDYIREHDRGYIAQNTPADIAATFAQVRDDARADRLKSGTPDPDVGFDTRATAVLDLISELSDPGYSPITTIQQESPAVTTTAKPAPRIGIIGCDAIAESFYLPALTKDEGVRAKLVLIDPNEDRLRQLSKQFDVSRTATDYQTVLGDLDGAIVAVPPFLHHKITLDCLDAGLHVLCEKPLALNSDDAREMVEKAAEAGRELVVNYTRRMIPTFTEARKIIAGGTLGKLTHIDYQIHEKFNWPTVSGFYFDWRLNTQGVLFDRGVHILDTIAWWLGDKPTITAAETDSFGGPEAVVRVGFEHEGCTGEMFISILQKADTRYTLTFENGKIEGEEYDYTSFLVTDATGEQRRVHVKGDSKAFADIGQTMVNNFVGVVRGDAKPLVTGAEVLASAELIDEAYAQASRFEMPWYDAQYIQNATAVPTTPQDAPIQNDEQTPEVIAK